MKKECFGWSGKPLHYDHALMVNRELFSKWAVTQLKNLFV